MKTYKIHLIRHGLTQANIKGLYVGATDTPLAPQGIKELNELKNKFNYPNAGLLYVSPMKRCVQTADILYPDMKKQVVENLKECDFGDWENKNAKDLEKDKEFLAWLSSGQISSVCTAENLTDFTRRVCSCFENIVDKIIKNEMKDAIVVTHGGVIMTLLASFGIPKAKAFQWGSNNGCGYSIRITPGLWVRDHVFEVYDKVPESIYEADRNEANELSDVMKDVTSTIKNLDKYK